MLERSRVGRTGGTADAAWSYHPGLAPKRSLNTYAHCQCKSGNRAQETATQARVEAQDSGHRMRVKADTRIAVNKSARYAVPRAVTHDDPPQ